MIRTINFARTFFVTIVAVSAAVCSGAAVNPVEAATASLGEPSWSHQAAVTSKAQTRSSGLSDSDARSSGDVIVGASQGVFIYSNTLKLVGQINNLPGRPLGMALDAAGNLYIANTGTSGIPVYKNDYKTLLGTLAAPNGSQGVAVAKSGLVGAVSGNQVTFYASGSMTPCANLSLSSVGTLYQGAFDASGNFYITGSDHNYNGIVGVIRGGCSATELTLLSTANVLGEFIYGIQVTQFGKIAVGDQSTRAIYTYNPLVNGALGQPIATTTLPSTSTAIYQFGFTAKGAFVFVPENAGVVEKFAYPTGGNPLQSFGQKQQLDHPMALVVAAPTQP